MMMFTLLFLFFATGCSSSSSPSKFSTKHKELPYDVEFVTPNIVQSKRGIQEEKRKKLNEEERQKLEESMNNFN
jgi:hypothetical protein